MTEQIEHEKSRQRRIHARVLLAGFAMTVAIVVWGAIQSRYILGNIDGISYLSIARQYAAGQWETAINAYWSPLISWLIAPLLVIGVPEILAFNLISGFSGVITVGIGSWLVWRSTSGNFWATGIFLGCTAVFVASNLFSLTPDMLVVTWVMLFLAVLVHSTRNLADVSRRALVWRAVALGAVGTLGYVTKLYLVPVFLVTLLAWWALAALARNRRKESAGGAHRPARIVAGAAAVALILSLPWIATLSVKYGMLTAGSSLAVNLESKFEPVGLGEGAHSLTLWAPPNENAISFGEDRTFQVDGTGFQSESSISERISYYAKQRISAFPHYITKIGTFAPWAVLILSASAVALLWRRNSLTRHPETVLATITGLVYFAGYAAITSASSGGGNARYYWPLLVLTTLIASIAIPPLWSRLVSEEKLWRRVLAGCIVALLPLSVLVQHGLGKGPPFSTLQSSPGLGYLVREAVPTAPESFATESLAKHIAPGSKLVGSNYRATLISAYFLEAQVYGRAEQGYDPTDPRFQELLRDTQIDYYLLYTPVDIAPVDVSGIGPRVATFETESTCSDVKGAAIVRCTIDIYEVNGQ